ncbi:MAG: hypothetical protein JWR19_3129 [Pedosphaera sp.]|nr:hypothetical protein [Pedosphaera sp.]
MRLLATNGSWLRKPAVLLLAGLLCMPALAAGRHGAKIEFSEPATPTIASNLNRLNTSQSAFKQAQDEMFRPFQPFNAQDASDVGTMPFRPRTPTVVPDKKTLEMMERRKNWAFTDSADLMPQQSYEDILHVKQYGPDGKEKAELSPVQKYYESLGVKNKPAKDPMVDAFTGDKRPEAYRDFAGTNAFSPQQFTFSAAEGRQAPSIEQSAFSGSGLAQAEHERQQSRQRTENFKALLDGRDPVQLTTAPGSVNAANLYDRPNTPMPAPAAPVEYRSVLNSPVLQPFSSATQLRPRILDDPTARALGLPQPMPQIKVEPPKQPAPLQTFTLPVRRF